MKSEETENRGNNIDNSIENQAQLLGTDVIVFERHLPADIDIVWQLIATKEGLAKWFMPVKEEIVEGEPFSFQDGWDGSISKVIHHQSIRYVVNEYAYLEFEVEERENGCHFRLIDRMGKDQDAEIVFPDADPVEKYQPGGVGTHWSGVVAGYHGFVDALEYQITKDEKLDEYDHTHFSKQYMKVLDEWHL